MKLGFTENMYALPKKLTGRGYCQRKGEIKSMNVNDYKVAMCKLIESCTRVLMEYIVDPSSTTLSGYFNVKTRSEEVDIAKSMSIYFYKAWFTEKHDFDVMSNRFYTQFSSCKLSEQDFIESVIHVAMGMEDPSNWNVLQYPLIIFDDLNHTKPVYIKVTKGKLPSSNDSSNQ